MDCVNHPGVSVSAYCQNCGKPLCSACVHSFATGQILCEPCHAAWQSAQQRPFAPPPDAGIPNPGIAAVLGIIPGVGAMYNGQFFKGFVHVIVFAILVSITSTAHSGLNVFFALLIPAWVIYQSFEAYHTANARRAGLPLPDPLGLNELGNWFQAAFQNEYRHAPMRPPAANPYQSPAGGPSAGPSAPSAAAGAGPAAGGPQTPYSNPYQTGYQPPPFAGFPAGAPPASGFVPGVPPAEGYVPGYPPMPPVPPVPPVYWRRREPIAAVVLIALGFLFLAGQLDWFSGRFFEFTWPLLLIALGAWLVLRRMQESVPPPQPGSAPAEQQEESAENRREIL
jgi:TM2 domain-containing membrane protein YozV